MITVSLTPDEADFLSEQLAMQIAHVDAELVHTDTRAMQRDLAKDLDRLQALRERLEQARRARVA